MTQDLKWYLYNQLSDKRFDSLTFEQAVEVLNQHISYKFEVNSWVAWNQSMKEWRPLHQIDVLFSTQSHKPEKKKIALPPVPVPSVPVPPKTQEPKVVPKKSEAKIKNTRRYERYPVRLRVVLFLGDKTFRTYTTDLSEGGMMLESKVPDAFLEGTCEIFIGSPDLKENVQFTGKVIGDAENPMRFGFVEHGENSAKRMIQWLSLFSTVGQKSAS